jgi:SOS-response transcriptional repressor LexA
MDTPQDKLLALASTTQINSLTFSEIASRIGVKHRSQAQYYIEKLVGEGQLIRKKTGEIVPAPSEHKPSLITLPVFGSANCGPATMYATGEISEVIHVSPSLLKRRLRQNAFAVKAKGDSMTAANISGKTLEDGDYAVVEPVTWQNTLDGDYVLSIIDGLGNIKKVAIDSENQRVVLSSESREFREDIIVDAQDIELYSIAGRVVDVVKGIDRE